MGRVKAPRVVEKRATKRERGHKLRHNEITATVLIKGGRRKKFHAEQVIHAQSIVAGTGQKRNAKSRALLAGQFIQPKRIHALKMVHMEATPAVRRLDTQRHLNSTTAEEENIPLFRDARKINLSLLKCKHPYQKCVTIRHAHHAVVVGFFIALIFDIDWFGRGLPDPCPTYMHAPQREGIVLQRCEVGVPVPRRVDW